MIEVLTLSIMASLSDFPTYTDTQWIHTLDWSARIKVNYYEENDFFEYDILNAVWSTQEINYFDLGNGWVLDDMYLAPGTLTTYELTSFGGYEHGTGFIGSDDYQIPFNIIVPTNVPSPGSLVLLGIAGLGTTRRRRR